ncbi:hemogen [Podarcis raffonei]|uniref:hemogen n=1 Tax=Podarcis raffonei TaxID=65483 RepID=UPI002329778B|nr:hemogen [Podarcis raffonei]
MESLEKDHSYSENPQQPVVAAEDYAVPEVAVTRHLRDRELLRKRKAEAEEKNTHQWVLREQKRSKPTGRGRGARRGRGRGRGQQQAPEPQEEPQPETVVEEEKPELQVTKLEEAAQKSLDLPAKSSIPFLEAGELYTQKELAEGVPLASAAEELCTQQETAGATPAGSAVFSMEPEETPRSEEPGEIPQSVENDHLEQKFYGLL